MSENRLTMKHSGGFFAAGAQMKDALGVLSDGAFKIFVYVCLHADRRTAQLRFRMAELAQATGHSTRSLTSYLQEIGKEVGIVYRAANQHELGRIEIRDRFWPYQKQAAETTADPEQALYVARVRGLFLEPACVQAMFSAADEKLAADWYRAGFPFEQIERAVLIGCARKYVALFNHPDSAAPISSLHYFAGPLEEITAMAMPLNYWRYLAARVRKMESQWRAHANSAPAAPAEHEQTK